MERIGSTRWKNEDSSWGGEFPFLHGSTKLLKKVSNKFSKMFPNSKMLSPSHQKCHERTSSNGARRHAEPRTKRARFNLACPSSAGASSVSATFPRETLLRVCDLLMHLVEVHSNMRGRGGSKLLRSVASEVAQDVAFILSHESGPVLWYTAE